MNCQEIEALKHAYADRELDLVRTTEIERHLSHCRACSCRSRKVGLPAVIIHIADSTSAGWPACHCFSAIRNSLTCFTSSVRNTASSRCRKFVYSIIFSSLPIFIEAVYRSQ